MVKTNNMDIREKVKQLFTEYLTKRKHRKTPERYAILDMIYSIDGHFNIDSLYTMMEETAKFRVSRATLYNTLILLLDAHLVVKHQFGTTSQYEKCFNQETHHHMICTQCGKVTEFNNEQLPISRALSCLDSGRHTTRSMSMACAAGASGNRP